MDFLNNAIKQISSLFRTMTPGARITAGLLLAVVVVSLGYLFQQGTAGPDVYLFGGEYLPESQLNEIEAAIAQAKLSGHQREGNRIRVPAGQQAAYLAAVADAGALPPNFNKILENALDKGGPLESRQAVQERLKIAKQQTLSEIVRAMYWVDDAVVLYDEQQPRGLSGEKHVTGSVSVQPILGEVLDGRRAKMLQKLVAHAVAGLKSEDVAVTNLGEGGGGSGGDAGLDAGSFDDPYYQTRVTYEQYKRQSILNALRDIPGVRVEVNAEIDDTVQETTLNVKPDLQTATMREVTKDEKSVLSTTDGGGQPGPSAQGPSRQATNESLARRQQNETSNSTTETQNAIGEERHTLVRKGFTPKEAWATVTIPRSYVEIIWKQRNPDAKAAPSDEDLRPVEQSIVTKVENIVEPLLPRLTKGEYTYKQVRVVVVDSLPAPEIEPPSIASLAMAWTGRYWTTLAMLGVAVFSLMVLRSLVGGPSPGNDVAPAASSTLTVHAEPAKHTERADDGEEEPAHPRLKLKKGATLRDELVDIVHEDPDAAAAILRTWIGKAG
jgi:flagellar M-ring protein FliF